MVALKENPSIKTTPSAHILIMEDDLNVARGLKMVLDEDGYDVDLRDTGYGALDAMGQYQYDLLMADLRLPDIDGMQVIKKVRATNPSTGIIAMTGYATNDLAVDAIASGDLRWINNNVGELNQKQLLYVFKRLEQEVW